MNMARGMEIRQVARMMPTLRNLFVMSIQSCRPSLLRVCCGYEVLRLSSVRLLIHMCQLSDCFMMAPTSAPATIDSTSVPVNQLKASDQGIGMKV